VFGVDDVVVVDNDDDVVDVVVVAVVSVFVQCVSVFPSAATFDTTMEYA